MKKISIAFLAALSLASFGCKKKGDDMMGKMTEFKDKMCACKAGDKDCATKVQKEMQEYAEAHKDMKEGKLSDEDMKKATDIGMEMAKCSSKAMGMGGDMMGGTPPAPPAGGSAAPAGEAPAGGSAAPAAGSAAPAEGSAAAPAAGSAAPSK